VVLWSLALGGIALIALELYLKRKNQKSSTVPAGRQVINHQSIATVSYKNAVIIGIIQSISVVPGVSRAAATIFGGMLMGMDRKTAVEFSFLLAIPTMLAATGLDLVKTSFYFSTNEWIALGIGIITSFVVAIFAIKWLLSYVKKYSFIPFGIYRIAVAIFLFGLFFFGK